MQVTTQRLIHPLCSLLPALILILALYGFGRWYDPIAPSGPDLFHSQNPVGHTVLAAEWRGFGALAEQSPEDILVLHANGNQRGRLSRRLEPVSPGSLFRLRGYAAAEQITPGSRPWQQGRVVLLYRGPNGQTRWDYPFTAVRLVGTQDWTAFDFLSTVPDFATSGRLRVINEGRSGRFKVKEMSLVPMHYKPSNRWWDGAWVLLWCGVALWYSVRLGLWSRPAGWLILLLTGGIVVGMLIPSQVITTTHLEATQAVEHQIERMTSQSRARPDTPLPKPSNLVARLRLGAVAPWMKSLEPRPLGHLVMFLAMGYSCGLMFLAGHTPHRVYHLGRKESLRLLAVVAGMAVYAAAAELLQVLVLSRSPAFDDWWLNMQGFAMGTIGFILTHGAWYVMRDYLRSRPSCS